MNYKLLKELMKESETPCNFDPNKFAELIIRECVSVADYNNDGYYVDDLGRKLYHYHREIGKEILDYFGLKEQE